MASLTLRNVKGSGLTHKEADQNFGTLFVSASITGSAGNLLLFSRGSGSTAFDTGSGAVTASVGLNLQHITNVGSTTIVPVPWISLTNRLSPEVAFLNRPFTTPPPVDAFISRLPFI